MKNVIVEIKGPDGKRTQKLDLNEHGISIGRGWGNDVVIQDRFVDAKHLHIHLDDNGGLCLSDLSSTNGSRVAGKLIANQAHVLQLGDEIKLGDTCLRLFDIDTPIAPAALRSKWFSAAELFTKWPLLLLLTVIAFITQTLMNNSRSPQEVQANDVLVLLFSLLIILLSWSVILGFISKLLRGEGNFKALWGLACLAVIAVNIISAILLVVRFNLQDTSVSQWLSLGVFSGFSVWLLMGVFSYVSRASSTRKLLLSTILCLSVSALFAANLYLKEPRESWSSYTQTEATTLPPAYLFRSGVSLEQYQSEVNELFDD